MSHRLYDLPRPAIIAHRGASHYAPENTLAAFRLAVEQGADGVELDVRLSADRHLIVIHDASVSHTTSGRGWVANLALNGLQGLDAGHGEKIPTLDEVFETLGKQFFINVELKPLLRHTKCLAEKVAHTIQRHQMQDSVICSSFSPPALKALAQYASEIPRGLLLPAGFIPSRLAAFAARTLTYQTLHPHFHDILNGAFSPDRQPRSPRIFTYTVNGEDDMRQLFKPDMNDSPTVDGIFTDDPILARRVRGF
jgi:glycerophosphoryl diester phosphodiesterase